MKFAKFWENVEISVDKNYFGNPIISVWGASNDSIQDAIYNANLRADKLKALIKSGNEKIAEYEYGNGFIKEEVVEEILSDNGQTLAVLSRNSYGALILNAKNVLFGDIDVTPSSFISSILEIFGKPKKDKTYFINKVESFQLKNPEYTIRLYETFAGLRMVISNKTLSTNTESTRYIFSMLDIDPLYVKLCNSQSCFRARLSPKPWRASIDRPPNRFPRKTDVEKIEFSKWLKNYNNVSREFCVTKLINTYGTDKTHPDIERVLLIHDKYSCSTLSSKLA